MKRQTTKPKPTLREEIMKEMYVKKSILLCKIPGCNNTRKSKGKRGLNAYCQVHKGLGPMKK